MNKYVTIIWISGAYAWECGHHLSLFIGLAVGYSQHQKTLEQSRP